MLHLRFLFASLWIGAAGACAAGVVIPSSLDVTPVPDRDDAPFRLDAAWRPTQHCAYQPVVQQRLDTSLAWTADDRADSLCGTRSADFAYRHAWDDRWVGLVVHNTIGLNARYQTSAALMPHEDGEPVHRDDAVRQGSVGLYAQSQVQWNTQWRSVFDLRGDAVHYNPQMATSSARADYLLSPRFSVAFQPSPAFENYLDVKYGIQDRYARAPSMARDATSLGPGDRGASLVRARGTEAGVRSRWLPQVSSTMAFWRVDLGGEPLFATHGMTDERGGIRWEGAQWTNYWSPLSGMGVDADLALFRARADESDAMAAGFDRAATAGLTMDRGRQWFGGVRFHYLDPARLLSDNAVRTSSSSFVNLRLGYRFDTRTRFTMDLLNVFGHEPGTNYGYEWRAPAGASPFDLGARVAEPRALRIGVSASY